MDNLKANSPWTCFEQVQLLDLSGNKIEDEGLSFLVKSLDQITELSLYECNLGAESVRLINERLMETKHKASWRFDLTKVAILLLLII